MIHEIRGEKKRKRLLEVALSNKYGWMALRGVCLKT